MSTIGIPIKLLHEAEGHTVTIELKGGEVVRGVLSEAEDNMNCELSNLTHTSATGLTHHLSRCYIRGSQIRFVVVPDMLRHAPMFKRVSRAGEEKGKGEGGRGRGVAPMMSGGRGGRGGGGGGMRGRGGRGGGRGRGA